MRMQHAEERLLRDFTHTELLRACQAHPQDEAYWSEFIHRFNALLVRSIATAWRRATSGEWPAREVAADLLQDCYIAIVKDDYRLLRNFRGASDGEVEAYLAHAAIHQTISYLRARGAQKRQAELVSWEDMLETGQVSGLDAGRNLRLQPQLALHEVRQVLQEVFRGPHSQRDILIFLLHIRDGWSTAEIAAMKLCDLQSTSIANLLSQMKSRLKKYLAENV